MAWRSSGRTNAQLISNMAKHGIIRSERVLKAMNAVDRANYAPTREDAYEDSPQLRTGDGGPHHLYFLLIGIPIGHGATISAPHMHAYAVEHLLPHLKPGARVLDVGSGSGYLVAVLHELVSPGGTVVGIDHIPELIAETLGNLEKDGKGPAWRSGEIELVCGDGRSGFPERAPYDAIHVGAAAPTVPQALIDQLASPGRMFIPVGNISQYIEHIDKDEQGNVHREKIMSVRYVPLTDKESQLEREFD